MALISGPIVSTIFCFFFAAVVFLTDTIHLLFPVVESRRYHASMLNKLFGPLLGIKDMDKFHAWLTTVMLIPIIAGIWHKHPTWSLITITILATLQPYFVLFAYYMKSCNLRNPILPAIYSAIFGIFGLVWRMIDYDASYLSRYDIPMITIWHLFISSIVFCFICRIRSNIPKLHASIQLEKVKAECTKRKECSWPDSREMPIFEEGFEPYPILIESAADEQEQIVFAKSKKVVSLMFLVTAMFMFGTVESTNHRQLINNEIINVCVMVITLPLVLMETDRKSVV